MKTSVPSTGTFFDLKRCAADPKPSAVCRPGLFLVPDTGSRLAPHHDPTRTLPLSVRTHVTSAWPSAGHLPQAVWALSPPRPPGGAHLTLPARDLHPGTPTRRRLWNPRKHGASRCSLAFQEAVRSVQHPLQRRAPPKFRTRTRPLVAASQTRRLLPQQYHGHFYKGSQRPRRRGCWPQSLPPSPLTSDMT